MPAFVFFLFAAAGVIALMVVIFRHNGEGPGRRGFWGGWGRGPDDKPVGPPPKDPGPNPDGLLEIPYEWIEAHGKWAKQVVRDNLKKIMVNADGSA